MRKKAVKKKTAQGNTTPKLVVGVGASAGGLEAFKQFLAAVPENSGMAFILVQHLDPRHDSMLARLLASCTTMQVREADDGLVLERDTVYIIRPDTALAVRQGRIELSEPTLHRGVRLLVDHLFCSLAEEYGHRAAAIVLTGAGSDGSVGIRAIKEAGGLAIAQSPGSSAQAGMPQSAIDTGVMDLVLDIDEMPAALQRFTTLPVETRAEPAPDATERTNGDNLESQFGEADLQKLTALLDTHANFDLRVYKPTTIRRRVLRRFGLSGVDELEQYFDLLQRDTGEQRALVRDLLISVTNFFRDPEAFDRLRQLVIDPLVTQAEAGGSLRVWVPGCATGEEAYSIGMEFLDSIRSRDKQLNLQIFATDVDQDALSFARSGLYSLSIADQAGSQRLKDHFRQLDGKGYQVNSSLRELVSFSPHDLTKDPPISRMDLISCRNVLIYLTPEAQKRVLKALHFALRPGGHLFLGTSETPGPKSDLYSTVSEPHRIYRKFGSSLPIAVTPSRDRMVGDAGPAAQGASSGSVAATRYTPSARNTDLPRRAILQACVPPTVVVSGGDEIVYTHGELGRYLRFPEDDALSYELSALLRPAIATRVRSALYKCRRKREPVTVLSSPNPQEEGQTRITVIPVPQLSEDAAVISFEEARDKVVAPADPDDSPEQDAVIEQLETELHATREDLRTTVDELETANEELRSWNEESMSMNEELQSANEELEATSEELRSLNEELTTVNAQLREKVEQLEQAHDDLNNFFSSTNIATLFLDERLRIKRLTPAARNLLGVDRSDVGRAVGSFAGELMGNELESEADQVLRTLSSSSREIHTKDGWIVREVLPYQTESRHVEGVVVTFTDVTELKMATERLRKREQQQRVIAKLGIQALREVDLLGFFDRVVRDIQHVLDADFSKIAEIQPGDERLLLRASVGLMSATGELVTEPADRLYLGGYVLRASDPVVVEDLAKDKRFSAPPLFEKHGITSGISCVIGDGQYHYGVVGAFTKERRVFSHEDVHFMQAVANVVGSAISRAQTRKRADVELALANVLSEATDLDELYGQFLERVSEVLRGCAVAEYWTAEEDGRLFRRTLHVGPFTERDRVEEQFSREFFEPGEGLIGRALEQEKAMWITDLGRWDLFVRTDGAKALGLVSAVAFPVRAGNHSLGVIAFFFTERLFFDENTLRSLETTGRSIGDYVARWRSDEAARDLAAVTASSHDAIFCYENDGTITKWLPGAEALYGYASEEMIGATFVKLVPKKLRKHLRSINKRVWNGEPVGTFETRRIRKDGTLVHVSVRLSPMRDRNGRVVGMSSTDRDISRQKETERQLREADRQKDEFLAMLGHELRNPLAAIQNATELLQIKCADEEAVASTLGILSRQTRHMASLLEGLLDISRIIRGQINLDLRVIDLAQVCREVISDTKARLGKRKLNMHSNISRMPVWIDADPVRTKQIVDNLLSNAVKYTPDGGKVTVSLKQDDGEAVLTVRDTGIGIEADLLPSIFEIFRQSKQSLDRSAGGLGIGLSLVKTLIEKHGGSVQARSEGKDRGSEFVARWPMTDEEAAPRESPGKKKGGALRVLIVEDNQDAADIMRSLITTKGHEAVVAYNGSEGISLARKHRPDIVLCDLGLPDGVSGFDVAKKLRADPNTREITLVALSGYGRSADRERSSEAGFDRHVTKPVDWSELSAVFGELQ